MSIDSLCEQLSMTLPPIFECSPAPHGVRVRTPLLFPDGGVIDVFVVEQGDQFAVTDFGDAAGWLDLQTFSRQRSHRRHELIEDTCQTLGIELNRTQLIVSNVSATELTDAVLRIAQAEARVADVWFTMRQYPGESTANDVHDWLISRKFQVERDVKVVGKSNREWSIDFLTNSPMRKAYIILLSTGTRGATRRIAEHAAAGWYDLRNTPAMNQQASRISLFDDKIDVWRDEDFRLVEDHSIIARWTRPDQFEEILTSV